jgi:hypothetical protein
MSMLLPAFFVAASGVCLLLVLLALWHSLRNVLAGSDGSQRLPRASLSSEQRALVHEKDELLAAIRELRFEHELGKVNDADLQRFEQRYRARAREVLRMLDEQLEPHREQARALIEQALAGSGGATATRIEDSTAAASAKSDATAAALATAPSAEPAGAGAGAAATSARAACPECSASNEPDAVFCKKCGARLRPENA